MCITSDKKEVESALVVEKEDLVLSWDDFARDTSILAEKLKSLNRKWKGIVAITRGGLVPASILANKLSIRVVDTMCISSYDNKNQRGMNVLKEPLFATNSNGTKGDNGDGWLFVDDLVDSGNTIRHAREMYPKAYFAVVYAKPDGIESTIDIYAKHVNQCCWIFFPWEEED